MMGSRSIRWIIIALVCASCNSANPVPPQRVAIPVHMEGMCPGPDILERPEVREVDAPETGSHSRLTFKIIDHATGKPLVGASVRLARDTADVAWIHEGLTNRVGESTTVPVPAGDYWAIVHYVGYKMPYTQVRARRSAADTIVVPGWPGPVGCAMR